MKVTSCQISILVIVAVAKNRPVLKLENFIRACARSANQAAPACKWGVAKLHSANRAASYSLAYRVEFRRSGRSSVEGSTGPAKPDCGNSAKTTSAVKPVMNMWISRVGFILLLLV